MKDLTQGNEGKLIFYFALPMLIGNIFQQLYNTVDSIIVGNTLGKEALAAVGASFPIIFLLVSLIMGIAMGSTILIAQFFGAGKLDEVKKTIDTTYIFIFFSALAATIIGFATSGPILKLLRTPDEVFPMAKTYLDIIFAGIIVMFGFNSISAILRGLGDSKTPLYFLIISTLVNIGLDLLFIKVFNWGVAGAAWATVIAQGVSFLLGAIYLHKTHEFFSFNFKKMAFERQLFITSIKIGLPAGVQQMLVATGMMALSRIVNGFGTNAVAAYTAAGRLDSFASMPAMNLSAALSSFVGQNLGANKPERVKNGYLATLGMATLISVVITITVTLFGRELISLFNTDPDVIQIGTSYLIIVGSFYLVFSSMFITNGVLRGAGDTFIPMFFTICSLWLVRVPISAYLSRLMGTNGIWWGIPIAWTVGAALSGGYYLTGRWKRKVIVKYEN
ncbi:MAG TPA: MATE family efflux transporter [Firmicutes bacterium]|jgi:putative MATE family efflux protein|nr:MATE family efflux transporter [Bacillota bacterium]HBK69713.1 MATE family efflux transporter [Bacillota bacterium]HBT15391.1 MATE family efflux transporter [Bacillota bacterium]